MANFNPVNNISQDFGLNVLVCLGVSSLAEEADDTIFLLCIALVVAVEASLTDNFCTVFALFGVDWNLEANSTPHQFGQLFVSEMLIYICS